MEEFEHIESREITMRAHSKKETYDLLSSHSGVYLSPLLIAITCLSFSCVSWGEEALYYFDFILNSS